MRNKTRALETGESANQYGTTYAQLHVFFANNANGICNFCMDASVIAEKTVPGNGVDTMVINKTDKTLAYL
jgi:hypothetical protein